MVLILESKTTNLETHLSVGHAFFAHYVNLGCFVCFSRQLETLIGSDFVIQEKRNISNKNVPISSHSVSIGDHRYIHLEDLEFLNHRFHKHKENLEAPFFLLSQISFFRVCIFSCLCNISIEEMSISKHLHHTLCKIFLAKILQANLHHEQYGSFFYPSSN